MWARKSNDNGLTWLADDMFSDVVSPLPALGPGDYDYGSAIVTKHLSSWTDGRVAINGVSQPDAFFDQEPSEVRVTPTPRPRPTPLPRP
jgi:hypothetical protein